MVNYHVNVGGLGAVKDDNGNVLTGDTERANILNDYFTSMCTEDNGVVPVIDHIVPNDSNLESIAFTPESVFNAIKKLTLGGASGPGGFRPRLFANLANSLVAPLSLLFTSFMSVGKVPLAWKHAIVTPV